MNRFAPDYTAAELARVCREGAVPPVHYQALFLRCVAGWADPESAAYLGITEENFRQRCSRGSRKAGLKRRAGEGGILQELASRAAGGSTYVSIGQRKLELAFENYAGWWDGSEGAAARQAKREEKPDDGG